MVRLYKLDRVSFICCFLFTIMVYADVKFGQLTDGHLTAFLHHSGVCSTCKERLKEMIDTEVRERMTLVSITHNVTKSC